MNLDTYHLLTRRTQARGVRIDLHPAGQSLGEALRLLADVVDETIGAGATVIDGWGIGFQFAHGGSVFDMRLVSNDVQIRCLTSPFVPVRTTTLPQALIETQEVPAIKVEREDVLTRRRRKAQRGGKPKRKRARARMR